MTKPRTVRETFGPMRGVSIIKETIDEFGVFTRTIVQMSAPSEKQARRREREREAMVRALREGEP